MGWSMELLKARFALIGLEEDESERLSEECLRLSRTTHRSLQSLADEAAGLVAAGYQGTIVDMRVQKMTRSLRIEP